MIALWPIAVWTVAAVVDAFVIWRLARGVPPAVRKELAEVDTFVRELRRPFSVPLTPLEHHVPAEPASRLRVPLELTLTRTQADPGLALTLDTRTPIFDAVTRERRRRVEALRMPTMEMRTVFDALVDRWLCSHCDGGDCGSCPGCSCSCRMAEVAA